MRRPVLVGSLGALVLALGGCDQRGAEPGERKALAESARLTRLQLAVPGRQALAPQDAALASRHLYLPPGTRSLLPVHDPLVYGAFVWDEEGVPPGPLIVWVDLRRQLVSAFRGGHEIGTAVILYGAGEKETPLGEFAILRKDSDYHSRTYDAPMPHSLFLTDDGVALHGSTVEGGRATHGCVGLPPEFARLLFAAASRGDRVEIVRSDPALGHEVALR